MKKNSLNAFMKFLHSRKAIAIPTTFLILFVTTLGLISVTYYFAVEKVNSRSQALKIVTAKEDFLSLDQSIISVIWQPGAARTIAISDSNGRLVIDPSKNYLILQLTDDAGLNETLYNGNTGQVRYELPFSGSPETGLFLKGDMRTIVNQSGSVASQLGIQIGIEHPEIRLNYRPTVSVAMAGLEEGKTVNNVHIYLINLNTSDSLAIYGKIPLRVSCESVQLFKQDFTVPVDVQSLTINCSDDGANGKVAIPISSSSEGAVARIEIVQCNVKVARSLL